MTGYQNRWKDFPDYILSITKEIWEDRGIATLHDYYAPDIPVRTPMGVSRGNEAVIASTMATLAEFPDRQLLGEDVIWSNDPEHGYLSSHRIISTATQARDGAFGPATGRRWTARVIADCAVRGDVIYDEWLVRDYGGIVRQMGMDPRVYAASLIASEGGPDAASRPFSPASDIDGEYHGMGNDNAWGEQYAETLTRIMGGDFAHVLTGHDRAAIGEYPGAVTAIGREAMADFWIALRSAFPSARFTIHHRIGMDADMLSPRAAIRWSLDGTHDGWGAFGRPTGAPVHIMGMSHAEFGPWGLRREFTLYDEIAIWKQILLHQR
ncbi:nuclear transport factor 2 family protein [Anianabacter salinae]|uniref:nuclear transport factor 2 family protein n=1 Tax=Anianabacter salinae TaxID=2851023 RepID=UPI00225DF734|nr:nuclear transport factor 2 family protein [Anianabacter salinae]MBV0914014.1 ester cyclase [Anianabacter salinae]